MFKRGPQHEAERWRQRGKLTEDPAVSFVKSQAIKKSNIYIFISGVHSKEMPKILTQGVMNKVGLKSNTTHKGDAQ